MSLKTKTSPLQRLEGRWTLRLLVSLVQGSQRFADFRAAVPGVSANLLTLRLRSLEQDGLEQRAWLPPPAARTVYELGPEGRRLQEVLLALEDWSASQSPESLPVSHFSTSPTVRGAPPTSEPPGKKWP